MKKLILLVAAATLLFSSTYAQQKERVQEVGFVFRNFNYFGATYRIGNTNSVWRITALTARGRSTENETVYDTIPDLKRESSLNDLSFAVGIGRERRINIVENFDLRLGGQLSFGYEKDESTFQEIFVNSVTLENEYVDRKDARQQLSGGLAGIVGVNYNVKNKLIIGLEILPEISYSEDTRKLTGENYASNETTSNTFSFNAGLSFAMLSLAYRF